MRFAISISGIQELKEELGYKKLSPVIQHEIGIASLQLHNELKSSIFSRYNIDQNIIDSALQNKSSSIMKFSKNIIEGGLIYKSSYVSLSKFPYKVEIGNIRVNAKHTGRVHITSVKRNSYKLVKGKYWQGGFVPIKKGVIGSDKGAWIGPKGSVMLERTAEGRKAKLTLMFAPTINSMILGSLSTTSVEKALNKLETAIIEAI